MTPGCRALFVPSSGGPRSVVTVAAIRDSVAEILSTRASDGLQASHVVPLSCLEDIPQSAGSPATAVTLGEIEVLRRGLWALASEADWALAVQLLDRLEVACAH